MKTRSCLTAVLVASLLCIVTLASLADTIAITLEDVYVTEYPDSYFIRIPSTGTVLRLLKADLSSSNLSIMPDKALRESLLQQWEGNRKKKPAAPSGTDSRTETPSQKSMPGVDNIPKAVVPNAALKKPKKQDAVPPTKSALTEEQRYAIFSEISEFLVANGEKVEEVYPWDKTFDMTNEEILAYQDLQWKLTVSLDEESEARILAKHGITHAQINAIQNEAMNKNWHARWDKAHGR